MHIVSSVQAGRRFIERAANQFYYLWIHLHSDDAACAQSQGLCDVGAAAGAYDADIRSALQMIAESRGGVE